MDANRDILGEVVKCKKCPLCFENFDDLRFHVHSFHQAFYHRVNRWLGKTEGRLSSLESVAGECRRGYKAGADFAFKRNTQIVEEGLSVLEDLEQLTGKGGDTE